MSRPRNFLKVVVGGIALFLFQYFEGNVAKQLTFVFYIIVLFVETWFTDNAKKLKASPGRGSRSTFPAPAPAQLSTVSAPVERQAFGDFITIAAVFIPLAIMADSFFFTTWLDLPGTSAGPDQFDVGAVAVVVKIVASILALAIAFLGPIVVAVFLYVELTSWMQERSAARKRAAGKLDTEPGGSGCFAFLPAAAVCVLCFGHFFLSYAFYDALGALRVQ
ncbi:hypothetical protein [Actinoplanes sp. NPDC049316]|uniref:hypothetical protein n=1 Tax=Actinoplanes sp. NPDC049316 TaxID=3154727 RepID=UPI00343490C8